MEILNFEQDPTSKCIAIFDIYDHDMDFHGRRYRLMQSKNGHLFINEPSYSKEQCGNKDWYKYFEFGERSSKAQKFAIMNALKPFIDKLQK